MLAGELVQCVVCRQLIIVCERRENGNVLIEHQMDPVQLNALAVSEDRVPYDHDLSYGVIDLLFSYLGNESRN